MVAPARELVCLTDEVLMRFTEGLLSAEEIEACEVHLDRCAECRVVAAAVPRGLISTIPSVGSTIESDASGLAPGRYRPLEILGRGGMGLVYRAYDPNLKREVAFKVVSLANVNETQRANARARLLREAEALAKLSHPNIINVYDVGLLGQDVFVAMELVRGKTLRGWLETPQRPRKIVDVFVAAAAGLHAAHTAGIVHRDFKPDNVMISDDGTVKVLDFGLARVGPDDLPAFGAQPAAASPDSGFMGTPRYMAPEQMHLEATDARTDQYGFCVALYEALYGRTPALDAEVRPVFPARPRVAARVKRGLLRGLSWDRVQRYPSMVELMAELRPPRGRSRWMAAAAMALLFAGLAFAWLREPMRENVLAAGASERTPATLGAIHAFLKENVENKVFVKDWTTAVLEPGALESESRDREWVHDVILEGNRLTFRRTIKAEQWNYKLDLHGGRIQPGKQVDRSGTRQYVFSARGESPAILGFSFPLEATGWEESLRMTLENGALVISGKSATEFDRAFTSKGDWKPAVFRFTHTYLREPSGQLVKTLSMSGFDYDIAAGHTADRPYTEIRTRLTVPRPDITSSAGALH